MSHPDSGFDVEGDEALVKRAGEALRVHGDKAWDFQMTFTTAFQIGAQLQLALRHPGNDGAAAAAARAFLTVIESALRMVSPDLLVFFRRGEDPAQDVAGPWPKRIAEAMKKADSKIAREIEDRRLDPRTALAVLGYVRMRLAHLGCNLDDLLDIAETQTATVRALQSGKGGA